MLKEEFLRICEKHGMIEPVLCSIFDETKYQPDVVQLDEEDSTELQRAGIDELTCVDTFMNSNGRNIFVQEV